MIKLLWRSVPCSHTGLHNKAMSAARIKRSCDRKLLEAAARGGKGWRGGGVLRLGGNRAGYGVKMGSTDSLLCTRDHLIIIGIPSKQEKF